MMESNEDKIWRFMRLTNVQHAVAIEMLNAHGWDCDMAVRSFKAMLPNNSSTGALPQYQPHPYANTNSVKGEVVQMAGGPPQHPNQRVVVANHRPTNSHPTPVSTHYPGSVRLPPPVLPKPGPGTGPGAINQGNQGGVNIPIKVYRNKSPKPDHLPSQDRVQGGVSVAAPPSQPVARVQVTPSQSAPPPQPVARVQVTPSQSAPPQQPAARTQPTPNQSAPPPQPAARVQVTPNQSAPGRVTGQAPAVTPKPVSKTESSLAGAKLVGEGQLTGQASKLQVDNNDSGAGKTLRRGLSRTTENQGIIDRARNVVLHDIEESADDHSIHFIDTPEYTFVLPNLLGYPEDFRAFLHKDLIEMSTLVSLEQRGRLNWWADTGTCQRLLPLATTGDGNCLLHAASLGMWGFHDRLLTLRTALYNTMTSEKGTSSLYRRWRWHTMQANKEFGLKLSENEWEAEWNNLLRLASTKPRSQTGGNKSCCHSPATKGMMERIDRADDEADVWYESLEEFHVFVLAHVLRRPIIIVADVVLRNPSGEPLSPILFGGVYLPLECPLEHCHRSPLLLTYDVSHFSALVAMDKPQEDEPQPPAAIPLVDPEFKLLPIHYIHDPGPKVDWNSDFKPPELTKEQKLALLQKYLITECLPIHRDSDTDSEGHSRSDSPFEGRQRSNSCSSGKGSDKEKDKSKLKDQIDSVTKSFGSIGKSMGQKLKKFGKAMKVENKKNRKGSVGSVTQSTNRGAVILDMLQEKDHILCARLNLKRASYQEQMISNYMHAARQRFEEDKLLRRQRDEAVKEKAEQRRLSMEVRPSTCVNQGCKNTGTAETSYMCRSCYDQQRQQLMNMQPKPTLKEIANQAGFNRQDTLVHAGKSKFYTYAEEDNSVPASATTESSVVIRNSNNHNSRPEAHTHSNLELARSSFYSVEAESEQDRSSTLPKDTKMPTPNQLHTSHPSQQPCPPPYQSSKPAEGPPPRRQPAVKLTTSRGQQNGPVDPCPPTSHVVRGAQQRVQLPQPAPRLQDHHIEDSTILPCRVPDCSFFGSMETEFLCSGCYKKKQAERGSSTSQQQKQTFI